MPRTVWEGGRPLFGRLLSKPLLGVWLIFRGLKKIYKLFNL